ncbi:MAG: GDP-L-fucose synthase [Candidatus Liptonbacteria bacterium]|nr:GDP-L-fucose synthase [Candidatus Liptonbacteria bacterium]
MGKGAKIYVAGHRGLVGSAIMRLLQKEGYTNIVARSHEELDLTNTVAVGEFFKKEKPEYVFDAAAKVGGIYANSTFPADFIYENLAIQNNIIHASYEHTVKKLLFLSSSCTYPKDCPQPMKEEYLLTGVLEPTNKPYAVAKLAGVLTCQSYNKQYGTNFISVMPSNAYGPNDHYDLKNSHVLPAFIRKFFEAKTQGKKEVVLWGTGSPYREFIHVDDIAAGCLFLMNTDTQEDLFNLGTGVEISIKALAELIGKVSGYEGRLTWDTTKPDGVGRKLMDMSRMRSLGWKHAIELEEGVKDAYEWYAAHYDGVTGERIK